MKKALKFIVSSIIFLIAWFGQITIAMFLSMGFYGGQLVANPIIAVATLAGLFTSYKLVKRINKSSFMIKMYTSKKDKETKPSRKLDNTHKSQVWKKWGIRVLTISVVISGLVFAFSEFSENQQNKRHVLRHEVFPVSSIYNKFNGLESMYTWLYDNGMYIESFEKFKDQFLGNDSEKMLLHKDMLNYSYFEDHFSEFRHFDQIFTTYQERYIELKTNDLGEIKKGIAYDVNGNLLGLFSDDGNREGPWKEYYSDNTLAIEGEYKNGLMHGYFKHFSESGVLRHEGKYINGSGALSIASGIPNNGRDSTHVFYYVSGEKEGSFFYTKNSRGRLKLTRLERWYKNGVKSKTSEYNYEGKERNVREWDEKGLPIKK
jgi:antitoxin component YwqK of YwqJK toxin-antitoxin module